LKDTWPNAHLRIAYFVEQHIREENGYASSEATSLSRSQILYCSLR